MTALQTGPALASAGVRALEGALMTATALVPGVDGREAPHAEREAPHAAEHDLPGADEQLLVMSAPLSAASH